jgi:hypothetical protein
MGSIVNLHYTRPEEFAGQQSKILPVVFPQLRKTTTPPRVPTREGHIMAPPPMLGESKIKVDLSPEKGEPFSRKKTTRVKENAKVSDIKQTFYQKNKGWVLLGIGGIAIWMYLKK